MNDSIAPGSTWTSPAAGPAPAGAAYAWTVFALTFGLMLSDYMSRQVIGAVFPFLKSEWGVSDAQLGALVGIVSIVVGLLAIPLSLLADRWGRVRSITLMAFVWCAATLACGLATSYGQLLAARALVGVGEAAYAAAGAALLAHTFAVERRAAVQGAFQSAGLFGSVLGVVIGGAVASQFGWRIAFFAVGTPGLLLALGYPFFVRDYAAPVLAARPGQTGACGPSFRLIVRQVFAARSGNLAFAAYGLQLAMPAILFAWLPTFLNRFHGFAPRQAAMLAALAALAAGLGALVGGGLADRLARRRPSLRAVVPAVYAGVCGLLLAFGFGLPPGAAALGLILAGAVFTVAHGGCAVAIVMDVTHPAVRTTVSAVTVLGASLLGLAPGPLLVGLLSDQFDLRTALTVAPVFSLLATALFLLAARSYEADAARQRLVTPAGPAIPAKPA